MGTNRLRALCTLIACALAAAGLAACGAGSGGSCSGKSISILGGLTPPAATWTWSQFQADAKALTKPAIKQYGTAYVTPGSEDTVWHWEVLLWEAGGQILNPSNTKAAFNSPAGLASLNTLRTMAVTDHSMYLDPTDSPYANLFNSSKVWMLVSVPW